MNASVRWNAFRGQPGLGDTQLDTGKAKPRTARNSRRQAGGGGLLENLGDFQRRRPAASTLETRDMLSKRQHVLVMLMNGSLRVRPGALNAAMDAADDASLREAIAASLQDAASQTEPQSGAARSPIADARPPQTAPAPAPLLTPHSSGAAKPAPTDAGARESPLSPRPARQNPVFGSRNSDGRDASANPPNSRPASAQQRTSIYGDWHKPFASRPTNPPHGFTQFGHDAPPFVPRLPESTPRPDGPAPYTQFRDADPMPNRWDKPRPSSTRPLPDRRAQPTPDATAPEAVKPTRTDVELRQALAQESEEGNTFLALTDWAAIKNFKMNQWTLEGFAAKRAELESIDKRARQRYIKLSLKHHPDKGGDAEIFKILQGGMQKIRDTRDYLEKVGTLLVNSPAR
jgi:hypothetical protein